MILKTAKFFKKKPFKNWNARVSVNNKYNIIIMAKLLFSVEMRI